MSNSEERLYDLSLIEEMAMGDESFMKEIAETFVSSVPPVVELMVEYCKNGEWQKMGSEAHHLKSNVDTLQIFSIKEEIRTIEANGKHGLDLDITPAIVDKVKLVLDKVIDQIRIQYGL